MARISEETINHIREAADILEIVSDYVELRRRGRNFFGLCPFHTEKTPSFSVAPDKQIFHCFGCGVGGNVITFMMEYEKISFVEALEKLAQRYGIQLTVEKDEGAKEFYSHLYDIHNLAVELYRKNLKSASGKKVRQYLEDRSLMPETVQRFSLGLSGTVWDRLYTLAKSKKFPDDVIEKCGLFTRTEKGIFDRFRGRLMFPITNLTGRVVALAGRDLEGESEAKYLNSPETPAYNKSEILYGFSETKETVRRERSVIVVEGYMDFLQLHQNGIVNIVATSGTALTEKHASQIRKFADTAYLAYDGDAPGKKAAIGAGYTLLRSGVTPQILPIPEESDPDTWVRNEGVEPFRRAIENAADVIEFHLANTELDLSRPADRSRLASQIADEIAGIRDQIIKQHTVKRLAEELAVDERILLRRVARRARKRAQPKQPEEAEKRARPSSLLDRAQMEIVKLLASGDLDTVYLLKTHLKLDLFSNPVMKSLASYLLPAEEEDRPTELSGAVDQFSEKGDRDLATEVLFEASPAEDSRKAAVDCLIALEQRPLKEGISEQRLRLRQLERNGKDASSAVLEVVRLQKQLKELENKRTELLL